MVELENFMLSRTCSKEIRIPAILSILHFLWKKNDEIWRDEAETRSMNAIVRDEMFRELCGLNAWPVHPKWLSNAQKGHVDDDCMSPTTTRYYEIWNKKRVDDKTTKGCEKYIQESQTLSDSA